MYEGSLFSASSPTFAICVLFDNSHSNKYGVISHCGFGLHFPDDQWCWAPFHVTADRLHFLFGHKCLFCSPVNFLIKFFFMLSCMSCLYMLDINPLLVIPLANIFSHSVVSLFVLSIISFAVQKLLSLIRSHLFIFVFISFALGDRSKKYCCDLCHRVFCLCFPLRVW